MDKFQKETIFMKIEGYFSRPRYPSDTNEKKFNEAKEELMRHIELELKMIKNFGFDSWTTMFDARFPHNKLRGE